MQLYLAKDISTGQLVALKTPFVNFEDDPEYLQHFMYEKWVGQRVQSPNVVKIYNSRKKANFLAYAMVYVKGQTLRAWMDENKRPEYSLNSKPLKASALALIFSTFLVAIGTHAIDSDSVLMNMNKISQW